MTDECVCMKFDEYLLKFGYHNPSQNVFAYNLKDYEVKYLKILKQYLKRLAKVLYNRDL